MGNGEETWCGKVGHMPSLILGNININITSFTVFPFKEFFTFSEFWNENEYFA